MLQRVLRVVKRRTAALAVLAGCALPAHAVLYTGSWDPSFGSAFPDLGWRGEATFFVPDACLSLDGWVQNTDSCSASQMQLVSAEVGFYSLSDPDNPALQETLLFDLPSSAVVAMQLDDGLLTAVIGSFVYSRTSTLPLSGGPFADFVLFFEEDIARMSYFKYMPGTEPTTGFSDPNPPDGAPFITFRRVPEPGSALILVALWALLLQRRAAFSGSRRRH